MTGERSVFRFLYGTGDGVWAVLAVTGGLVGCAAARRIFWPEASIAWLEILALGAAMVHALVVIEKGIHRHRQAASARRMHSARIVEHTTVMLASGGTYAPPVSPPANDER